VARTTTVSDLPFAPVTNPTRKQPKGLQNAKAISVTGPLGTVIVPIQDYVTIHWDKDASSSSPSTPAARSGEENARRLTISVANESDKRQRSVWGLTRALLSNAIEGVQEGHTVTLRLVGVGYRAAVETDPFPRPDKFQSTFAAIGEAISSMAGPSNQSTKLGNFTSAAQRDFYAALTGAQLAENEASSIIASSKIVAAEANDKRLALRLGYSHPIYMPIPRGVSCTTPAPTRIVLKGADKDALGLFASAIRRWRPPEPYKGKGVFVGDETIRIKAVRKK
jgi:large subunit ribosomal protein L6